MRRLVMILLSILIIIAVTGCNPSGSTSSSESSNSQESPKTYVLTSGDDMFIMPAVTLYENGGARLSQPVISSFALLGLGHYQVNGDELTVTYDEGTSAAFSVSDTGDSLTLTSSNFGYTKIGAVYQYRPKADYYRVYSRIDGEDFTLEMVRELAKKAQALTITDFEKYTHFDIDPDYHVFEIEDEYTLRVIYTGEGNTSCEIERNSSGEKFPLNLNGSTRSFPIFRTIEKG